MYDEEGGQFSLRWNNFHTNLTNGFICLMEDEDLVDVTLAASGGELLRAHKMVLSVCSPYFKELFKATPCKHPVVVLKDVSHNELSNILQFMYRGEVNICQEQLTNFLKTAESLQVRGLTGNGTDSPSHDTSQEIPHTSTYQHIPQTIRYASSKQREETKTQTVQPIKCAISEQLSSPPQKRLRPEQGTPFSAKLQSISLQSHDSERNDDEAPRVVFKSEPVDDVNGLALDDSNVDCTVDDRKDIFSSLFSKESNRNQPSLQDLSQEEDAFVNEAGNSQDLRNPHNLDVTQGGVQFIANSRGNYQLVHEGHVYNMNGKISNRVYWRCTEYPSSGCRGRCILTDKSQLTVNGTHNHPSQENKISRKRMFNIGDVPTLMK